MSRIDVHSRGLRIASGLLFIASLILSVLVSEAFIVLGALSAFLPDLLRLTGVLRDSDEFQHEASGRASRYALAFGVVYAGVLYWLSSAEILAPTAQPDAWLVGFALMVAVWFLAYEMTFWDARAAAPRVFVVFGVFWAVFVVASEWGDPIAMLVESAAVVAPFALAAAFARRLPRLVGAGAVAAAIAAFAFFRVYRVFLGDLGSLVVLGLIVVPLAATGVGLVRYHREDTA